MKAMPLGILMLLSLTLPTSTGYACWCGIPDVQKALDKSGAVFVGQVVDIVPPGTSDQRAPLPGRFYIIKFKVEKSWKGADVDEINILSGQGKYACFDYPPVSKGEKYLVYADKSYNKDWLVITACNRTALIPKPEARIDDPFREWDFNRKDASHDLKMLERISKPSPFSLRSRSN